MLGIRMSLTNKQIIYIDRSFAERGNINMKAEVAGAVLVKCSETGTPVQHFL